MRNFYPPPGDPSFPMEIMIWSNFNLNNLCFYINGLSFLAECVSRKFSIFFLCLPLQHSCFRNPHMWINTNPENHDLFKQILIYTTWWCCSATSSISVQYCDFSLFLSMKKKSLTMWSYPIFTLPRMMIWTYVKLH